jgi:4-hydroxy-tetrahydrodipicolinate synthase
VIPAALCPFQPDLSLDEDGLRRHLRFLVQAPGVTGVCVNGHAGEVASLTPEEQVSVIRVAKEEASETPIIAGIYAQGTREACDLAHAARQAGADALLVFPPPVFSWGATRTDRVPLAYVEALAAVGLPLVIFQYPPSSGLGYSLEALRRLAEISGVVAVKEGSGEMRRYEQNLRMLHALTRPVSVLTSNNDWLFASLCVGADGILSGAGSVIPDWHAELFQAVSRGDLEAARKVNDRIVSLSQVFYADPPLDTHNRMKTASVLLGRFACPLPRPPLLPIVPEEAAEIASTLEALGLLRR